MTEPTPSANAESASSNADGQLLADVNAALHDITTLETSEHATGDANHDADIDTARLAAPVTLTKSQISALVKLEQRIRSSLSKQQREFTRRQQKFTSLRRRVLTGDENVRVRDAAKKQVDKSLDTAKKQVRKAVTGDPERPLNEWIQENRAKMVKTVDKFSFCLGVVVLMSTEYMVLEKPHLFGLYYCALVSVMMALRIYLYAMSRYLYFMLDFCYWANATCFFSVLYLPDNRLLWRLNFAVSNGTLLGALLAWRNSLVFHSLDKVTSIAIHFLPALLTYIERWSGDSAMCSDDKDDGDGVCTLGFRGAIIDPLLFYSIWQAFYIIKTEFIDRKRMLADPTIQTSLRWLTRDKRNAMHVIAKRTCRAIGALGPEEGFDPEAWKTKLVFWIGQLIFTVITLLPANFLFASRELNMTFIVFVLLQAIYNGANYYFEVFVARYLASLEKQQQSEKEVDTKET